MSFRTKLKWFWGGGKVHPKCFGLILSCFGAKEDSMWNYSPVPLSATQSENMYRSVSITSMTTMDIVSFIDQLCSSLGGDAGSSKAGLINLCKTQPTWSISVLSQLEPMCPNFSSTQGNWNLNSFTNQRGLNPLQWYNPTNHSLQTTPYKSYWSIKSVTTR